MAVIGYAGFRQGTTAITDFSARYPSFEEEGAVFWAENVQPALPEMNCDPDKSDPVVCDGDQESHRARCKGGLPGSLEAIGAAGQGTRSGQRHDVVSTIAALRPATVQPAPSRFVISRCVTTQLHLTPMTVRS